MVETKDQDETTLHAKRKSDPSCEDDQAAYPNKSRKLQLSGNNSQPKTQESSLTQANKAELQSNVDPQVEDEEDEEEYDGEESNGKAEADGKGKGIMRDDKGKGILIEEDDEDLDSSSSSSSSSDGGSEFEEGDSDLSDDPLAEVDLDNILPSRTQRRQIQSGVYIHSDSNGNNIEDDDSDDSYD